MIRDSFMACVLQAAKTLNNAMLFIKETQIIHTSYTSNTTVIGENVKIFVRRHFIIVYRGSL